MRVAAAGWPGETWAQALLGLLNGGNILFYVHAHQSMPDNPATVFAGMNIGVVVLGALVGVFAFGEATTKWNRAGLALAVLAIGLIAWGEHWSRRAISAPADVTFLFARKEK